MLTMDARKVLKTAGLDKLWKEKRKITQDVPAGIHTSYMYATPSNSILKQ